VDFKKIISITLALCVAFGFNAMAEDQKGFYEIKSFAPGLNSQASSYLLSTDKGHYASDVRNVRFNLSYGGVAKRPCQLALMDGSNPITGLHRFYKADLTQRTINAETTYLYSVSDVGVQTQIGSGYTDGKFWSFLTYKDLAIGMNGYDKAIKWDSKLLNTANTDGHRTAGYLVTELGAPFAELNTGTDLDSAKWYMYKVAFSDGSTETYSDAKSNAVLTGAAVYNIALTDIPIGPTGTTSRILFRTEGAASFAAVDALTNTGYKLLATISDNSTTTYADAVADGALTTVYGTWITDNSASAVTPPLGKYCEINKERLFIAGNVTYPSELYWSDVYNPDYFIGTKYEAIREDDGDAITFIKNQLGILIVGKTNTIEKFYTDASSDSDWYASNPFPATGCPAPYSVANTPKGIAYLGRGGIYLFNGQTSQLISDAVTPEINDILETNVDEASGVYWKNEYQMAYTSLESGASQNNRVLIYDFVRDSYTLDYKNVNRWVPFGSGTDYGVLYSGDSTSDGYIYAQSGAGEGFKKSLKSEFNAGTFDDARVYGDETNPTMELAWDCTIDGWLTELQTKDALIDTIDEIVTYLPDAIIDRPDTDGTWTSPGYEVNASAYQSLLWNENLGQYGDITFNVRSATTEAGLTGSWSDAYTDPSGSDISGLTANTWVQFKINLSTTDIDYTPTLYVLDKYLFTMLYTKAVSTYESAYDSIWTSGWDDFGVKGYNKRIRRIKIFYTGTEGTLTFNFKNDYGDFDTSFDIDLSRESFYKEDSGNTYSGEGGQKVYTYYTCDNSEGYAPIGQYWQFTISENGDYQNLWSVQKVEFEVSKSTVD